MTGGVARPNEDPVPAQTATSEATTTSLNTRYIQPRFTIREDAGKTRLGEKAEPPRAHPRFDAVNVADAPWSKADQSR